MKIFEKNILKKIKQGDPEAFEVLFNSYHKKVYNFIRTFIPDVYEAENILQDVFVSIWETRQRINVETPFDKLIYRIARNKSLNNIRKSVNKKIYINTVIRNLPYLENTTDKKLDFTELEFLFQKYVDKLPDRRREIFLCSLKEGLTYQQIALKLNISENTVDTQIRKALQYIRENITRQYAIYRHL
jgi:RNA polymerase sigma-70 factor, ECF subfamily